MRLGVAYYGSHLRSHLREDLGEIKEIGCDDVVITLSENDMAYFPGKAKFAKQVADEMGLRIFAVPWGFGNLFGGGRISKFVLDRPETMQIDLSGEAKGVGCYNNPIFQNKYNEFIRQISELEYNGILIDEPTSIDCYCDSCKKRYKSMYDGDLVSADPEEIEKFRKDSVINFVKNVLSFITKNNVDLITQIAMMPTDKELWERIASLSALDIMGVDPYWLVKGRQKDFSWFEALSEEGVRVSRQKGKKSLIWINCWNIPKGDEEQIYKGIVRASEFDPDMIYAWSFKGAAGTSETCDDPVSAWNSLIRGYRELS